MTHILRISSISADAEEKTFLMILFISLLYKSKVDKVCVKNVKLWSCLRWSLNAGNVEAAAPSGWVKSHEASATVLMTGTAGIRGCACGSCAWE